MIRMLATAGRVVGIAALLAAPLSIGGVAMAAGTGSSPSTSAPSKDCSTLDKTTKAYRDCISGKSSGGSTMGK